jgi:putative ABC transport system ATP-binding protein
MPLIEVKNLEKTFEHGEGATKALRGVSLSIDKGEFVAIVGPSGSGKSTLLQILGLLDSPTGGAYLLNEKDVAKYNDDELAHLRNRMIGFIFQSFNLLARTDVLENVKLPLAYSHIPSREWNSRARKQIETVGLGHRLDHEPSELSGGERQRVAIARALVTDPEIIFADEPTGNLDSVSGAAVMKSLESFHNEGKTVILITHDQALARRAHRIIKLRDGVIEWDGLSKNLV